MPKRKGTCGEGGAATADAKSRYPRAMHMRGDSCHAGVARATDHNQGIEGTYLPRAGQRGRAVSCEPAEPCPCHSGTGESTVFYARCTLPNLTTCIHSPYSYILSVSKAKMAVRSPHTPSPRVTATGVDSAGPIRTVARRGAACRGTAQRSTAHRDTTQHHTIWRSTAWRDTARRGASRGGIHLQTLRAAQYSPRERC